MRFLSEVVADIFFSPASGVAMKTAPKQDCSETAQWEIAAYRFERRGRHRNDEFEIRKIVTAAWQSSMIEGPESSAFCGALL
jgi:hypothetical protein